MNYTLCHKFWCQYQEFEISSFENILTNKNFKNPAPSLLPMYVVRAWQRMPTNFQVSDNFLSAPFEGDGRTDRRTDGYDFYDPYTYVCLAAAGAAAKICSILVVHTRTSMFTLHTQYSPLVQYSKIIMDRSWPLKRSPTVVHQTWWTSTASN